MSKHINVNPDHYKVAGRERPGNAAAKGPRPLDAVNREADERWRKRQQEKKNRERT
jgi:hypothetical protein